MNQSIHLSNREREIGELLAWGAAKKEVADMLHISESTVANTARSIYEKLEIQKATELSVWWFCTRFSIPFDMSPLKKAIAAAILILAMLPAELEAIRSLRSGRRTMSEYRTARRKRNDDAFNYLPLI